MGSDRLAIKDQKCLGDVVAPLFQPTADLFARETVTFEGRLGFQHRDVLEALAKNHANVGIIFSHLAQYYAPMFPTLVDTVNVPGAERFSSTIAVTAASAPLRPRAATRLRNSSLISPARFIHNRGFATMLAEEFGQKLPL